MQHHKYDTRFLVAETLTSQLDLGPVQESQVKLINILVLL